MAQQQMSMDSAFRKSRPTARLPLILAFTLLTGTQASAANYASREVGGWTVAASKDGKGCFLTKQYERSGETTLLLGLDVADTNRLTILNVNWSIKPKDRLELDFKLSNSSYPKHLSIGLTAGGKQGFVTTFGKKFPAYFAASKILHVSRGDVPVERLNLDGSGAAVAELRRCVDAQRVKAAAPARDKEAADGIPMDPFGSASQRKTKK